jgi:hypothetical protein
MSTSQRLGVRFVLSEPCRTRASEAVESTAGPSRLRPGWFVCPGGIRTHTVFPPRGLGPLKTVRPVTCRSSSALWAGAFHLCSPPSALPCAAVSSSPAQESVPPTRRCGSQRLSSGATGSRPPLDYSGRCVPASGGRRARARRQAGLQAVPGAHRLDRCSAAPDRGSCCACRRAESSVIGNHAQALLSRWWAIRHRDAADASGGECCRVRPESSCARSAVRRKGSSCPPAKQRLLGAVVLWRRHQRR